MIIQMDSPHRPVPSFVSEARRNLALIERIYGRGSKRYRRLLRLYRQVSDILGCRPVFERALHRLRRRAKASVARPWRKRRGPS